MTKKKAEVWLILLFIGIISWLLIEDRSTEALDIGGKLPHIIYKTINGIDTLKTNNINKTLVLFFSKDCQHCKYELRVLEKNIKRLKGTTIYFLTTDVYFFESSEIKGLKDIFFNEKVNLGIVDEKEFRDLFGSGITPTLYFFSKEGILTNSIRGEARIEKILEELKKSDNPEYRVSGDKKSPMPRDRTN